MRLLKYTSKSGLVFALTCLVVATLTMSPVLASEPVGQITFAAGDSEVIRNGTVSHGLAAGVSLYEGDLIKTSTGATVHVTFIDGALLSVRSDSELFVEQYVFDAQAPRKSVIKLSLRKGVVRSISGEGAENARDKFRFNTPVAAIGVRGTDFVVQARATSVKAFVNAGGIVVASYSDDCQRDAAGPCESGFVELFAGQGAVVVVSADERVPRLAPLDEGLRELIDESSEEFNGVTRDDPTSDDEFEQSLPTQLRSGLFAGPPLNQRQMVWGRWGGALDSQPLAVDWNQASNGRKSLLGNGELTLFRSESVTLQEPLRTEVGFELSGFQGRVLSSDGVHPISTAGGDLTIDFSASRFRTQLSMLTEKDGLFALSSQGLVTSDGRFIEKSPSQWVAGGVTGDRSEAGYFFEIERPNLRAEGETLWNAR